MLFAEKVSPGHAAALQWFVDRTGQEVSWPDPLNGMFLVNKAKGIHKPGGSEHALSIRQSLHGPYEDAISWGSDGRWLLAYAQEGTNPDYFTNRALQRCLDDGVPVGVLVQIKEKPDPRYRVLGLGQVVGKSAGVFAVRQFATGLAETEAALDVTLPASSFDAANTADGRVRTMRAIAARRGQPAFRKALVNAYAGRCAVTGCQVSAILEAAHIIPYLGDHTNHVANGLLLRADIHTLFDLGLLWIEPTSYVIRLASELVDTEYVKHDGQLLHLPENKMCWPDQKALEARENPPREWLAMVP